MPDSDPSVEAFMREYIRRYVANDPDGVTEMCHAPFVAIRDGEPIHLADLSAVRDHYASVIGAYRDEGYMDFVPVEFDTWLQGESSALTAVRWHALDAGGEVVRDTQTTYHLLGTSDGWRLLSYTNHF